jgi:hypothetical protein
MIGLNLGWFMVCSWEEEASDGLCPARCARHRNSLIISEKLICFSIHHSL